VGGYLMNRIAITRYFFGGCQDMIMHIPRKRVAIDKDDTILKWKTLWRK